MAEMPVRPTLLLTGGAGLIGGSALEHLLHARPHRAIVALARRTAIATPGATVLNGDLEKPFLGLGESCFRQLGQSVTEILHAAAEVRFDLPLEQVRRVNVQGVERILELARRCPNLQKCTFVSTLYVAGRRPGTVREAPLTHACGFLSPYEQSKYEAEEIILKAARDLPIGIVRLSSVIGNSVTGRVRQFNYFHRTLRRIPRSPFPVIPGDPGAPVDLIADDWAGQALTHLHDEQFVPGAIRHLCNGPKHSLTVRELVDMCFRAYPSSATPEMVSAEEFQRYLDRCDPGVARLGRALSLFLPHLAIRQEFVCDGTTAALLGSGIVRPDPREFVPKVVRYCLSQG